MSLYFIIMFWSRCVRWTQIPALITKWLVTSHIQQLLSSEWNTSILCTIQSTWVCPNQPECTLQYAIVKNEYVCIMPLNSSISCMPHFHMTSLGACLIQRAMVVSENKITILHFPIPKISWHWSCNDTITYYIWFICNTFWIEGWVHSVL